MPRKSSAAAARHRKEHYYKKAKHDGYRARAVYKLKEMDFKFHLFANVNRVLDLCCAPGSWLEFSAQAIQNQSPNLQNSAQIILGVDLTRVSDIPGVTSIKADITKDTIFGEIRKHLAGTVQLVLSDCAPHVSGDRTADHEMQAYLFERALKIAREFLAEGGTLVGKLFQGLEFNRIVAKLKEEFLKVNTIKPHASSQSSPEMYVVAQNYLKAKK